MLFFYRRDSEFLTKVFAAIKKRIVREAQLEKVSHIVEFKSHRTKFWKFSILIENYMFYLIFFAAYDDCRTKRRFAGFFDRGCSKSYQVCRGKHYVDKNLRSDHNKVAKLMRLCCHIHITFCTPNNNSCHDTQISSYLFFTTS